MCWYADKRWKLGPIYYCRLCDLREKDLANGCPRCQLTTLLQDYEAAAESEIKRFTDGLPDGVTMDDLKAIYATVSLMMTKNKDEIDPGWTATLAGFAEIIIQERQQKDYWDKWEHWKQITKK